MLLSKNFLMRWIHWPILFSVCLHISIAAALLQGFKPEKQSEPVPMAVAMIQLAAEETSVSESAIPESVPEPPIPEPEPIAKIALPKPKPEKKPEVKKREEKKIVKKEPKPIEKKTEETSDQPLKPVSDQNTQIAKNLNDQKSPDSAVSNNTNVRNGPRALSRPNPEYPPRAQQLGTEGTVKVKFDVDENGRIRNIEIISANPKNVFERYVKNAMRKWRYEKIPAVGYEATIEFRVTGISQTR